MKAEASPYYPPRAGRGRYLYRALDHGRAWMQRSRLGENVGFEVLPAEFFKNCIVPGFGFRAAGYDRLARLAAYCWAAAFAAFIIWLGYPTATLALGLMMSIHTSSILCVLGQTWPQPSLLKRVLLCLAVAIMVSQFVYRPGQWLLENYCFMPITSPQGVYVINRTALGRRLSRGGLVAYRIHAERGPVVLRAGVGFGRILAVPGDVVEFTKSHVNINGTASPTLRDMPNSGKLRLDPDVWFIWPDLHKTVNGTVAPAAISEALLAAGLVAQTDILGKPFDYWLWRHQNR
jgi:hypothetical protein